MRIIAGYAKPRGLWDRVKWRVLLFAVIAAWVLAVVWRW